MIQLKISGRAGNQFFQYATVYSYIKKNNIKDKLLISFQELDKRKTDSKTFIDALQFFKVEEYETIKKVHMTYYQKMLDFLYKISVKIVRILKKIRKGRMTSKDYKIIEKIWHKKLNKNGLYYYMPTNKKFYESKNSNIVFYGSFESVDFFEKNKKEVYDLFTPKERKQEKNKKLYNIINNTNSICVTIRRGDFLSEKYKKNFYICTPRYFENAINEINKIIDKPQYIIFSDDIQWCKNNMNFPKNTLYEDGNDPVWEKLRLMYSCKHFIISNSTFSWWAQYLSRNEDKIVFAPKVWNNFEYAEPIYDKKWKIIE